MSPRLRARQAGVTLIELLVGLAIGLMTIAVALGALLVSRGVSGTVSDATQLQQQGAHALRVIGLQLRQAGSIRLNLAFAQADPPQTIDAGEPVAFETVFDRETGTLATGNDFALRIGYQNYNEAVRAADGTVQQQSMLADCLGRTPDPNEILSTFRLVREEGAAAGELQCAGADGQAETVIGSVADLQVRYLVQTLTGTGASLRRVDAAGVGGDWPAVVAVEVCLELVGQEGIDTAGATFRNCSWAADQPETPMDNRLHMVFRNTYQLRTQGAPR